MSEGDQAAYVGLRTANVTAERFKLVSAVHLFLIHDAREADPPVGA